MEESGFWNTEITRIVQFWNNVLESLHYVDQNTYVIQILAFCFVLLVILKITDYRGAIASKLAVLGQYGISVLNYIFSIRGRRKMQKANLDALVKRLEGRIQEEFIKEVEDSVDKREITRTAANKVYGRFSKFLPQLVQAIEPPPTGKEGVVERRANENRDSTGKIIPLPLPKEEPKQNKMSAFLLKFRKA